MRGLRVLLAAAALLAATHGDRVRNERTGVSGKRLVGAGDLWELLVDEPPEARQVAGLVAQRRVMIRDPLSVAVEVERCHRPKSRGHVRPVGELGRCDAADAHQARRAALGRAIEDPQGAQRAVERVDPAREMLDRGRAQVVFCDLLQPRVAGREQDPQRERLRPLVRVC